VSNFLSEEKKQQVIALSRLGSSLRRIFAAKPPERISGLRESLCVQRVGRNAAKPAIEVSTDSGAEKPPRQPDRSSSASACEPHRDVIEAELAKGRNAMAICQDLAGSMPARVMRSSILIRGGGVMSSLVSGRSIQESA